jgi:large-conductance mechanosensitive channel
MLETYRDQIKTFILNNGLISTIAGVGLGIITKDVIQSLVADIIIPVIIILISFLKLKILLNIIPKKNNLNVLNFVNNFVSWIITIIITFFFVTYSMKYLLNIDTSVNNKDKK